jgi:hypothetical protein
MRAKGSKAQLRAYYETAYGEAPSTRNGVRLPAVDIGIGLTQSLVQSRVLQGNRSETMPSPDQKSVAGTTTIQPDVRSIGWILRHLFGSYSVSGAGPYTHTFKVDAIAGSYMLEKFFSDLNFALQYVGCKPNGLNWDVGTGGLQECSVDWIGQDEIYSATPEDASPLLHAVIGFKVPTVTLSQAGVSLTKATRFGINIANNIEGTRTIGNSGIISDAPEGVISVTGPFEVTFESMTQYNKALNQTEEALVVTYPAAGGHSLQFLLDEVQYEVASPAVQGPGGLNVAMNYRAYYDDAAAATAIRAILINDVATYAAIP